MSPTSITTTPAAKTAGPWLALAAILALTITLLHLEGGRWWCACGHPWIWVSDIWSEHCSQHLLDPYSLTHMSHGLIFYWLLIWLAGPKGLFARGKGWPWSLSWRFCTAVFVASLWEVAENSAYVIDRYRSATMSLNYLGDSVANSLGDIGSCALGFFLARWLGFRATVILFVVVELILLCWIRDNLSLNVLMLLWPLQPVRDWQTVGHG